MKNTYLGKGSRKVEVQPETLYKKVNLTQDSATHEIRLKPLTFSTSSALNADAQCLYGWGGLHSAAPSRLCSCGFHAYKEFDAAMDHNQGGLFVVGVVASGKMFEYNKGYRYGHQRVEEVIVSSCVYCEKYADRLLNNSAYLYPLCLHHAEFETTKLMSFSELETSASASLPANSPRITVRSVDKNLIPWNREAAAKAAIKKQARSQLLAKNAQRARTTESIIEGVAVGLALVVGFVAIRGVSK